MCVPAAATDVSKPSISTASFMLKSIGCILLYHVYHITALHTSILKYPLLKYPFQPTVLGVLAANPHI